MFKSTLVILFGWGWLVSLSASPAVEDAYRAVVDFVSPGQQELSEESLRNLFNTLENRVQCGEVPCGKVSFKRLRQSTEFGVEVQHVAAVLVSRLIKGPTSCGQYSYLK